MENFDYIIVGAGSAGCVLAERLTASGKARVLLLEAGGQGRSPWIALPLGYGKTYFDPAVNWKFQTVAEASLAGRQGYWPRGKCIGGSGAINAMVYARGLPNDFDDWQKAGAQGWGWQTVQAEYQRLETRVLPDGSTLGDGPLHIQDVSDQVHKSTRHFFAANAELGLPQTDDLNGPTPEGAAIYQINTRNGWRNSSARAFLRPARRRGNLRIVTGAHVQRIRFDGRRATGLTYVQGGQQHSVRANREIILSAGSVASPRLLQLSGIGPADVLRQHGITPLLDRAEVGGNLQDHLGINYYFRATEPTLNNILSPLWGKAMVALQYALRRRGPLSLSVNQCGGFFKSSADLAYPDQQLYFNPVTYTTTPDGKRSVIRPDPFAGFILGFQPSRPTSRGRVDISSADPMAAPLIVPNSLDTEEDRAQVVAGARLCQRLARTRAMAQLIEAPMYCDIRQMDDDQILDDFRQRCGTVFHPVGTCRMGSDAGAVVTPDLKVQGITGLRVVDASVFPNITSGNTNAPTMMLAHRAARLIAEQT